MNAKVTAAGLGAAVATLIWFVIIILNVLPDDVSQEAVAGATGATATILSFLFGYIKSP